MRIRWIVVSITMAALALGAAGVAAAEDFTFTVPVKVLALAPPDIGGIVNCQVGVGAPPSPRGWLGQPSEVGEGQMNFDVDANGNFQGSLVVKANALPGRLPGSATHWTCILYLRQSTGAMQADQLAGRAKPGVPLIWTRTGTLP